MFAHTARHGLRPTTTINPRRFLDLHEYQSKQLMARFSIPTQKFRVVERAEQANEATGALAAMEYVVKAQIHAGGRGKGVFNNGFMGGVHLTKNAGEVEDLCRNMLGNRLVTKQTGDDGVLVRKVMIAEAVDIAKETYFAILMDRAANGPVLVASPDGGMDIEHVAETTPERIFKEVVDINAGVQQGQVDRLAKVLGFTGAQAAEAAETMIKLYDLFIKVDSTQVEINPLGLTKDGRVLCFDAKINFDDNAQFRQAEIFAQRDTAEEDPREIEAGKHGLNFVGMDGTIGCMVNGAGLAMATMDIIKLNGGSPANFLDLGGGVTEASVSAALELLTTDPHVTALLVNIFGGIVDCALVARGLISGAKRLNIAVPVTLRLKGTNEAVARELIRASGLEITMLEDLDEAAAHVVASA